MIYNVRTFIWILVVLLSSSYSSAFLNTAKSNFLRRIGTSNDLQYNTLLTDAVTTTSSSSRRLTSLKMSSKSDDSNPYYKGMDAYQVLEIPRSANKNDVKKAYRKAIATWHPDKFPDDEAKKAEGNVRMERINRAWYCLGDDDRRKRYDQFGEQGVGTSAASEEQIKNAGSPMGGGFGGGAAVDVNDISDIFDAFFGGATGGRGGGARQRQRNPNAPIPGNC